MTLRDTLDTNLFGLNPLLTYPTSYYLITGCGSDGDGDGDDKDNPTI